MHVEAANMTWYRLSIQRLTLSSELWVRGNGHSQRWLLDACTNTAYSAVFSDYCGPSARSFLQPWGLTQNLWWTTRVRFFS